jgi:hypothetical protein
MLIFSFLSRGVDARRQTAGVLKSLADVFTELYTRCDLILPMQLIVVPHPCVIFLSWSGCMYVSTKEQAHVCSFTHVARIMLCSVANPLETLPAFWQLSLSPV